ncbi:MAG: response regulator [Actinomycetota bacterium]
MSTNHTVSQVMVIDDDPFDQALIRSAFQRVGSAAHVHTVPDVGVAIGLLESREPPSLLIVDFKLGAESGLELIEWVRHQDQLATLPAIVLSGSDDPIDARAAHLAGANAYVVKPPDLEGLETVVRSINTFWFQTCALSTSLLANGSIGST